ncbi:MAG: glucosaminidase domain-containing protein [Acidimicrobiales bacterium]
MRADRQERPRPWRRVLHGRAARLGALAAVTLVAIPAPPATAAIGCSGVMGQATTTPAQAAGWFATTGHAPRLDVSVLELASMFLDEGAREGVRGDVAFAQSIVETGYFGFSPSVPPQAHNYSGIGATGGGVKGASFPDARTGVRARIQHLRAYADPSVRSAADLHSPLVDPRFGFLVPNARTVACWEQFGNGVWAADPTGYGPRVLSVHQRLAAFPKPAVAAVAPAPVPESVSAVVAPPVEPIVDAPVAVVSDEPVGGGELLLVPTPVAGPTEGGVTPILTQPLGASRQGGGMAGTAASGLTALALLSICTTLWWHGRRFARPG